MENIIQSYPTVRHIACVVGTGAPAIFSGITIAYNYILIRPLLDHAPPKLVARQFYQAYAYGPSFVIPLVIAATLSNGFLAYNSLSDGTPASQLYIAAALLFWLIMPYTLYYMEPGINGACKWKTQLLCKEDGFRLKEGGWHNAHMHTATAASKRWAEQTSMPDLVRSWAVHNEIRWIVTAVATVLSAWGTSLHG